MKQLQETITSLFTERVTFTCLVVGLFIKELIQRKRDEKRFKKEAINVIENQLGLVLNKNNEQKKLNSKKDNSECERELDFLPINSNPPKRDNSECEREPDLLPVNSNPEEGEEASESNYNNNNSAVSNQEIHQKLEKQLQKKSEDELTPAEVKEHMNVTGGIQEGKKSVYTQLYKSTLNNKYNKYSKLRELKTQKTEKITDGKKSQINQKSNKYTAQPNKQNNKTVNINRDGICKNMTVNLDYKEQKMTPTTTMFSNTTQDSLFCKDELVEENMFYDLKGTSSLTDVYYTDNFKLNNIKYTYQNIRKPKEIISRTLLKNQLPPIAENNEEYSVSSKVDELNIDNLPKINETILSITNSKESFMNNSPAEKDNFYTMLNEENLQTNKSYYKIAGENFDTMENENISEKNEEIEIFSKNMSRLPEPDISSYDLVTKENEEMLYRNLKIEKYLTNESQFIENISDSNLNKTNNDENTQADQMKETSTKITDNHLAVRLTDDNSFEQYSLDNKTKLNSNLKNISKTTNMHSVKIEEDDDDLELVNQDIIKSLEDDYEILKLDIPSDDSDHSSDEVNPAETDDEEESLNKLLLKMRKPSTYRHSDISNTIN